MNNIINILHVSTDEKFIDMALKVFNDSRSSNNKLIVLSNNKNIKHIKYSQKEILTKKEFYNLTKSYNFWKKIDIVIFHSLCTYDVYIPKNIKTIWLGFGYDYYDLIGNKYSFLGKKTKKALKASLSIKEIILSKLKSFFLYNLYKKIKKYRLIRNINYFCPVLLPEYNLINWNKKYKPILMDWNYGTLEDDWAKLGNKYKITGNNILLGNSATYSCNHIEGIDLLSTLNIKNENLIIPLSYGNKKYAEIIKEYTIKNYSGKTIFLEDYMPFDEYSKLISSCSHVVMPHKRQQALGNILILLYLGAKIFLDRENPIYSFMKKQGVIIYSLDDMTNLEFESTLTDEQVSINQKILSKNWSKKVILEKTNELIRV